MSAYPEQRESARASVAGVLATVAMFVALIGIVYRPARLIPAATIVALIALGMGGRHERLAWFALGVAALSWLVGMSIAIAVEHPVF